MGVSYTEGLDKFISYIFFLNISLQNLNVFFCFLVVCARIAFISSFLEEFNCFCLRFVLILISAYKLQNFTFTFIFLTTHLTMLAIGLNVLVACLY